jgi:hydrogenase maturation protein HypF
LVFTKTKQGLKLEVYGVVQGVGFRPFIYRIARDNGLYGWVRNTSGSVEIIIEGEEEAIQVFLKQLKYEAPPICHIENLKISRQSVVGYRDFKIESSQTLEGRYQLISPDMATCKACLEEIMNPKDRRYRYPFTNCTVCGPRFTIIKEIPYDRSRTTMARFVMCPLCQQEYEDLTNRRFHAQPNACPVCGPHLELVDKKGNVITKNDDAIILACKLLLEGNILAIKGLGGFLLACDATSDEAVALLRQRKQRPKKPLAVMFNNLQEARKHCYITNEEEELLTAAQSPIVLARWLENSQLSKLVAPNLKYQGIMLPYTPLHHLLLNGMKIPLVMTSGNLSEEPIIKDNDEALRRLGSIVDYYLLHDRDIYARYDDSVVMVVDKPQIIRRARGYAPSPIHLPYKSRKLLACGGELKNTFCLAQDGYAFISQHIADMENLETLEHFSKTIELYKNIFSIEPEIVAHDLHPDYLSTNYARDIAKLKPEVKVMPIQHHHAHIVSCMVENKVSEPVIGIAFDGTGYGSDGRIWGGEFLIADYKRFERVGHLEYLPLPGGDTAIKKPYRTAISYIYRLLGEQSLDYIPFIQGVDEEELIILKQQIDNGVNVPLTSSCGRLFDAVAALINLRSEVDYEAQAAIELEMVAMDIRENYVNGYPFSIIRVNGSYTIGIKETLFTIVSDLKKGVTQSEIAYRFHLTVAKMITDVCYRVSKKKGISTIALSGGVFQNRLLLGLLQSMLRRLKFNVLTHSQIPTNDACISLGQAVIANYMAEDN